MRTCTFRGRSMGDALKQVRRHFGGDAIILESREVRRRSLFCLGASREWIEITAARSPHAATSPPESTVGPDRGARLRLDAAVVDTPAASRARDQLGHDLRRVHALVAEASRLGHIDHLLPELPRELVPTYARLVDSDMPEALARDLVRSVAKRLAPSELRRSDLVLDALRLALSSRVQVAPALTSLPGTRQAVALVGPTGVGKTTTLAKLAARLQLDQKIRPGLITIDTYRAAAIEQLNTYARILGLPFAVAHEPDEMRQALDSLGDVDIALIDTAGGGPRDEPRIHELAEFLESARPREIHLVLSASADERSRHWAVDRFAKLRADRLILSKLDEASTFGSLAGVMTRSDLPISYLTTGQSVPDDLEAADPMLLARLVLPADSITAEAGPRSGSARPLTPMSRMHVFTSAITGQHSQDRGQL